MEQAVPRWLLLSSIGVPIIIIAVLWAVIYVPRLLVQFDYDFVYATCERVGEAPRLEIQPRNWRTADCDRYLHSKYYGYRPDAYNGAVLLVREEEEVLQLIYGTEGFATLQAENRLPSRLPFVTRVFYHDVHTNVSRELSTDEVANMRLTSTAQSWDGIRFGSERKRNPEPFVWFGPSYRDSVFYLERDGVRNVMNIIRPPGVSDWQVSDHIRHLGWVARP